MSSGQVNKRRDQMPAYGREQILEAVLRGTMTPAEAESEARRLGLPPFETEPDPKKFDPAQEASWSLLMALAWVMWRDFDWVRDAWVEAQRARAFWSKVGEHGFELTQENPSLVDLLEPDGSVGPTRSRANAQGELWRALRENRFTATGVNEETKKRERIAVLLWEDDLFIEQEHSGSLVLVSGKSVARSRRYSDVRVPSRAILTCWPPKRGPRPSPIPTLPAVSPHDDPQNGFMHLGDVVIWIATKGKQMSSSEVAELDDAAEADLVARLGRSELFAFGMRHGSNETEIPRGSWAALGAPRTFLSWVPDDEHGAESLFIDGAGVNWSRVRFKKEDVRRIWPGRSDFDAQLSISTESESQAPPRRKGAPPRARERAQALLQELFPNGIPEPAELKNDALIRSLEQHWEKKIHRSDEMQPPSRDTILRAAGRRIDPRK